MSKLFVMSVDSLFTDDLADVRHLPGFERLLERSAIFENVYCVYPTLTYVCHSTIMSGCWPSRHGVPHNQRLDPRTNNRDWYWEYSNIKVDTIFDYAKEDGRTTAAVGWPVTAGSASIDDNIPEVWSVTDGRDLDEVYGRGCSPSGFSFYKANRDVLENNATPQLDQFDIACEEQIIHARHPDVMLTHQALLDHVRHEHGVHAPEVQDALACHSEWISRIMNALEEDGSLDDTYFVVLGDHGHLQVDYKICPNVLLEKAGLLEVDEHGAIRSWQAYVQSGGISAQLFVRDDETLSKACEALRPLVDNELVSEVFSHGEVDEQFHGVGAFTVMFEASPNHAFGDEAIGDLVTGADCSDYKYAVSTHGHLPFRGERPCFMIAGPNIVPGRYQGARLVDEAPTLMDLVGIPYDTNSVDGRSLAGTCSR